MRYYEHCGIEMIDAKFQGEPFTMDLNHEVDRFSIKIPIGQTSNFLNLTINKTIKMPVNVKVFPKC